VGGSWRTLARFAMNRTGWPIRNSHGFVLEPKGIAHLVSVLSHTPAAAIKDAGVSSARAGSIADAACVLAALVRHLRPSQVIVSSFGLREGLAFADMPEEVRRRDPLIANLEDQLGEAAKGSIHGEPLHRWAAPLFTGESPAEDRLRLAASWLGLVVRQPERPLRRARALEVALGEPMIGADAADRGRLAAALLAFVGERALPSELGRLCSAIQLERAVRWGCVMRMGWKLSANRASLLEASKIGSGKGKLELLLSDPALYGESVEQEHAALASALALAPAVGTLDSQARQAARGAISLLA
jgi:exopolyphosphatase/guanosine-5'-triphosphate,3'-diphosphate pyrophosphatase